MGVISWTAIAVAEPDNTAVPSPILFTTKLQEVKGPHGSTVIVEVTGTAHCPYVGVNVYVVVVVLLKVGDHEPPILLEDIAGKGEEPPVQIEVAFVNVGVTVVGVAIVTDWL